MTPHTLSDKSCRVLMVFGTRPEVIKIAPVILAITKSGMRSEVLLVDTGQHSGFLDEHLSFWGFQPDITLACANSTNNLVRLLSTTLTQLQDVIDQFPSLEYVMVVGDTNTAMACAQVAFFNKLKLLHIEAGLRSFNLQSPFPEEFNRILATTVAHFHFAPTAESHKNLVQSGIAENSILITGNTVIDALETGLEKIGAQRNSQEHCTKVLITMHRRENSEEINNLILSVGQLKNQFPFLHFIWIGHPNYTALANSVLSNSDHFEFMPAASYAKLLDFYCTCRLIITDSGGITEEAVHLGIPVVVFRENTERIDALLQNYDLIISQDQHQICNFVESIMKIPTKACAVFGDGKAANRISEWLKKELELIEVQTAFVGGGPGGTGCILKSLKDGRLELLAKNHFAIIESSSSLLKGSLCNYQIESDTLSDVFLEFLEGQTSSYIDTSALQNEIEHLKEYKGKSIPLNQIAGLFEKTGRALEKIIRQSGNYCMLEQSVDRVTILSDGRFKLHFSQRKSLIAEKLILAPGAIPVDGLASEFQYRYHEDLLQFKSKTVISDALLRLSATDLKKQLNEVSKICILGGSHSAFSVADHILKTIEPAKTHDIQIEIWTDKKPKVFYSDSDEARLDGYHDFTIDDICPLTGRVYRLAGLRMNGRDLYRRMMGLSSTPKENRVQLKLVSQQDPELSDALKSCDLVIHALGYRLNMIPFEFEDGRSVSFKGAIDKYWVNNLCNALDENHQPIPNLFLTGLATGFIPTGDSGGESSFTGQTNGIWYYQNKIADLILDQILIQSKDLQTAQ